MFNYREMSHSRELELTRTWLHTTVKAKGVRKGCAQSYYRDHIVDMNKHFYHLCLGWFIVLCQSRVISMHGKSVFGSKLIIYSFESTLCVPLFSVFGFISVAAIFQSPVNHASHKGDFLTISPSVFPAIFHLQNFRQNFAIRILN